MKSIGFTMFFIMAFCLASGAAGAGDDYRDEIIENVVDICFREIVFTSGLDEYMESDDALSLIKVLQDEDVEVMIDSVTTLVEGKPLSQRIKFYDVAVLVCLNSISE